MLTRVVILVEVILVEVIIVVVVVVIVSMLAFVFSLSSTSSLFPLLFIILLIKSVTTIKILTSIIYIIVKTEAVIALLLVVKFPLLAAAKEDWGDCQLEISISDSFCFFATAALSSTPSAHKCLPIARKTSTACPRRGCVLLAGRATTAPPASARRPMAPAQPLPVQCSSPTRGPCRRIPCLPRE